LRGKLNEIAVLKAQKADITHRLEDELIPDTLATLISMGQSKVEVDGFTHAVYNGTNVSISQQNLQSVLLRRGIEPGTITLIMAEVCKRTPYTTITTLPTKAAAVAGGLTGGSSAGN